jgi:hypothetical protein
LISYDIDLGYWQTMAGNYPYTEFYNKNVPGDFYFLIEDAGTVVPTLRFFNRSAGPGIFGGLKCEEYGFSGLHRRFQDASDMLQANMARFDIANSLSGGVVKYILGGFTLPLNQVLYNSGYQDAATSVSSDDAVARVTADACARLKSENVPVDDSSEQSETEAEGEAKAGGEAKPESKLEPNSNIRIYLIEYKTTASEQIKSCASGSTAPYFQSAGSEAALNEALSKIAADIKVFARHRESYVQ